MYYKIRTDKLNLARQQIEIESELIISQEEKFKNCKTESHKRKIEAWNKYCKDLGLEVDDSGEKSCSLPFRMQPQVERMDRQERDDIEDCKNLYFK